MFFLFFSEFLVNKNDFNIGGILLSASVTCFIIFGIPLPFIASYLELDPLAIILNEIVLPHPYHQTIYMICIRNFLSFFGILIGVYYFLKYLTLTLILPTTMGVAVASFLTTLLKENYGEANVLQFYKHISICVLILQHFISQHAISLVLWSQIFLTFMGWIAVNCFGILPTFIIVLSTAACGIGSAVGVFLLQQSTHVRLLSIEMVRLKRSQFVCQVSGKRGYFYMANWKAQQPLQLKCGNRFYFTKDVIINYVNVLNINLTNAILLILP